MTSLLTRLNHYHVEAIDSTNSTLIQRVKTQQIESTLPHLLTASTQSAGRGQHQRSWQSPKGNVYLSLYYPYHSAITGLLSLIVGCELVQMPVITELNQLRQHKNLPKIGVKWANDIGFYEHTSDAHGLYLFNKLAGILIEPVWQVGQLFGVVIGVGMNIHTAPILNSKTQEGMSYQATALANLYPSKPSKEDNSQNQDNRNHGHSSQSMIEMTELYTQIAQALTNAMQRFDHLQKTPEAIDLFLSKFAQTDVLAGRQIQVSQDNKTQQGSAQGIDRHGCLQLLNTDGNIMPLFTGRIDVTG
ncbi:biotin--[acetyl-CoA-carboxylase] ligase [Psychrobacter sp. I-STPA6b]|uniref:biotin--[acetyl-CoA-carboxylase] ligase n=1 Tax=Psychrobacter sp. I-STPA6b TaxID=2585718 RepID=UPI001D0C740D|nr:biotin--[acetyl-CoA-carboxylase] ligase [Psychrobacter sp. I-STPA6b]